jgi:hypothetical protein
MPAIPSTKLSPNIHQDFSHSDAGAANAANAQKQRAAGQNMVNSGKTDASLAS